MGPDTAAISVCNVDYVMRWHQEGYNSSSVPDTQGVKNATLLSMPLAVAFSLSLSM